ncbi:MAG: hypothetical protein HKL81_04170 [Acidimicrobiaceae bacterium]|nr:hypothetical protein [Acidimicrobiaceae bacterium]
MRMRFLAPLAVGVLLSGGGAAFLATNTQPVSGEGVSSQMIDGYIISDISYNVDPPPPPPGGGIAHLQVVSVSFAATEGAAGESPAVQGFVRLDPPPPPPPGVGPMQWQSCTRTSVSGATSYFSCTITPPAPVSGPGGVSGSLSGWLDHLQIEVNQ